MRGYVISIGDKQSDLSVLELSASIDETESDIELWEHVAVTPESISASIGKNPEWMKLQYTWPADSKDDGMCLKTGLYKRAYSAKNVDKVIACALSHMEVWKICKELDEPIVVLEQDALFTRRFSLEQAKITEKDGCVGLNDPRGTTRKASLFYQMATALGEGTHPVPSVDGPNEIPLPQGLAGNSAYVLYPWAAEKLLNAQMEYGLWPNDAIMCKQLFPWLRITQPFYTKVQPDWPSTTTT